MALVVLAGCSVHRVAVSGATWPAGFDEEVIVDTLDAPTAMAYAPDGRIFITEKEGRVRVVSADGRLLPTPFATFSVSTTDDLGLIGIGIDPDFTNNHYVYLAYTTTLVPPNPNTSYSRIHRITRLTANGDVAEPGSEVILVDNIPSDHTSHMGGALRFGPDGKLYASIGDGASYNFPDPLALRALNVDEINGKVLRLNPDGSAPTDNPFYTTPGAIRSKVWQMGLRNPFKATFRPGTSKLYVNDVGWNAWEEANYGPAGASFGWPCYEGNGTQGQYSSDFPSQCAAAVNTRPLYTYAHTSDGGAITGGAFFQGGNYPSTYVDKYFIADYAQRFIRYVTVTANDQFVSVTPFADGDTTFVPVDLALAPDGNLHYLNYASDYTVPSGSLNRIVYVGPGNHAPRPVANATPTSGYASLPVGFDATGTTDADNDPLTYHWKFGDGVEADGFSATHVYTANGSYIAVLQVNDTHVTRESKVTITVGSLPPTATIDAPPPYRTYVGGEAIDFSGSATDPDDGDLGPDALHWTVIQHHNTHQHTYLNVTGPSGSFIAEGPGTTGDTIWYELVLTATDSSGLSDTERVRIYENNAPVANAGPDATASCFLPVGPVFLDGRASTDPDHQPIAYSWTQIAGPPVALSGADTATPFFVPPVVAGGTSVTFQLVVADGHVTSSDAVVVTIPDLTDADGDLFSACSDCAPLDPALHPPATTPNLRFAADKQTLSWDAVAGATGYDLERGTLSSPFAYNHDCFLQGLPGTSGSDPGNPPPGSGVYDLVRATSGCGLGDLGAASSGAWIPGGACGGGTTQTIPFDDAPGQDRALDGQYPTGVIDWGTGAWWLSAPWKLFTTKSASFNGPASTSESFTFVVPKTLVRLDAYNGGTTSSTVTLSCAGKPTRQVVLNPEQVSTIDTGWVGTCTTVTIGSSNGWNTNFDNLVIR